MVVDLWPDFRPPVTGTTCSTTTTVVSDSRPSWRSEARAMDTAVAMVGVIRAVVEAVTLTLVAMVAMVVMAIMVMGPSAALWWSTP